MLWQPISKFEFPPERDPEDEDDGAGFGPDVVLEVFYPDGTTKYVLAYAESGEYGEVFVSHQDESEYNLTEPSYKITRFAIVELNP